MGTRFVSRETQAGPRFGKVKAEYGAAQPLVAEEELAEDHPDILEYRAFLVAPPSQAELEAQALAALNGGGSRIDIVKLLKAKAISDEAYRLGKAPGALTAPELQALRNRIATIYGAL